MPNDMEIAIEQAASADVVGFRPRRSRVAVAFSTKDRVELTRRTVAPLLDDPDIDLYWFDGSKTDAGQRLAFQLLPGRAAACEFHPRVTGGPDAAILHALRTLRPHAYDLTILIENDVLVAEGWLASLTSAIESAERAGFKVGGASARVMAPRVLSFNGDYCLLLISGAGFMALKPAAIDIVLDNYRLTDAAEFLGHVRFLTGIDMKETVEFRADQLLSADFLYDIMLYLHGLVVVSPPVAFARDVDPDAPAAVPKVVCDATDHDPRLRGLITRPEQIRPPPSPSFRFQKSRLSERAMIGCHQLRIVVAPFGVAPDQSMAVRVEGEWRRRWVQWLGPFSLFGAGRITVAMHRATVGVLMYSGVDAIEFRVSGPNGHSAPGSMGPGALFELPLDGDVFGVDDAVIEVIAGQVGLVGVTASAPDASHYANGQSGITHLPV